MKKIILLLLLTTTMNAQWLGVVASSGETASSALGTGYIFSGSTDSYMLESSGSMLDGVVSQSWVFRIKIQGQNTQRGVIGNLTVINALKIEIDASDNKMDVRLGSSANTTFTNAVVSTDESWNTYILTYNGANLILYENGIEIKNSADPDFISRTSGRKMTLGAALIGGVVGYLVGEVSHLQFYSAALNTTQIASLTTDLGNTATNLVANFSSNRTLNTWYDEGGNYELTNNGGVVLDGVAAAAVADGTQLTNFRVLNGENDILYFDSNVGITGSNLIGVKVADKYINYVTVNSGQTTGHYFTMTADLSYWDTPLIRYTGGSNIGMEKFNLTEIDNQILEPVNSIIRYANPSGSGTKSGLSEVNAWSYSQAFSSATAGMTVYLKAGKSVANVIVSNDGTATAPIKFIGYTNVINDNPTMTRTLGMAFDENIMPFFSDHTVTSSKDYIIFKNLQVKESGSLGEIFSLDNSFHNDVINCYVDGGRIGIWQYGYGSNNGHSRIYDSYVANGSNSCIRIRNNGSVVVNTWTISSYTSSSTDYYINFYGGTTAETGLLKDNYIYMIPNNVHTGHGISLKCGREGDKLYNVLAIGNMIINPRGGLEFRHSGVRNCYAYKNIFDGSADRSNAQALKFQDGAKENVAEANYIKGQNTGILFKHNYEDTLTPLISGDNNLITNNIFTDCNAGIMVEDERPVNNKIYYNVFNDCDKLTISYGIDINATNFFINNIVTNGGTRDTEDDMSTNYNNSYNNGWNFTGIGNISINPNFVDEVNFKATNVGLNIGTSDLGVNFDYDGKLRESPYTIGINEI